MSRLAAAVAELRARPSDGRAARALERQLAYQRAKADGIVDRADAIERALARRTADLRARLAPHHAIDAGTDLLEVGSGAHGHVFFLDGCARAVGVDPLADHYRALFPWQPRARTLAASGESLPFDARSFDVVLCDNVIDHARAPAAIVDELVRVLRPGGLLYFTVNVHHRLYDLASRAHGALAALRVPLEIGPFADHTVHLGERAARDLLRRPELVAIEDRVVPPRGRRPSRGRTRDVAIDALVAAFPKNLVYEWLGRRC